VRFIKMSEFTEPFVVGSHNLAHWQKEKAVQVEADARGLLNRTWISGFQECGPTQYQAFMKKFRREGMGLFWGKRDGAGPGMRSTPIVWEHKEAFPVEDSFSVQLTPKLRIPLGAGPTLISPKWAHVVVGRVGGRRVNFINVHGLASVWARPRWFWVRKFFSNLAELVNSLDGLVFIVGDFNTRFSSRWMKPMREAGLKSLQEEKGPVVTHPSPNPKKPGGVIDDVLYRYAPFRVKPIEIKARPVLSDHHQVLGIFHLRPTKRFLKEQGQS
jgi:hypothetical protein